MDCTSRENWGFDIRPIVSDDMDSIPMHCWTGDRAVIDGLFEKQETLGFAAWEGEKCAGLLHCYACPLPDWDESIAPDYAKEDLLLWPLGWPLVKAREMGLIFEGNVWGHACFHVGRILGKGKGKEPWDETYFGCGIGTALCRESVKWARKKGYAAVLAYGAPAGMFNYAVPHFGALPYTTYAKMGFKEIALEGDGKELPWWAEGKVMPRVLEEVQSVIEQGRPVEDLCSRLMLLDIAS